MEIGKQYVFDGGQLVPLDEDTILLEYKSGQVVKLSDILQVRELRLKLIGERPYFLLVDCRKGFMKFTTEAKSWLAVNKESANTRYMDVLIARNLFMKIQAHIYLMFHKPITPTKIARSVESAMGMIEKFKAEHVGELA